MLGLTLREEFRGKRLKGTAIELSNDTNTGATQIAAQSFLEITYPTHDLLKGIEAVGPDQGRPVVVIGERGLGKSHLMALPKFSAEQRLDMFARAVEPTLQRELKHKGAATGDGSYSAELIGYVEILGQRA